MSKRPEPGDYVLHQERDAETNKVLSCLLKVSSVNEDFLKGIVEKEPHISPVHVEVPLSSIRLNFGAKPPEGTAFGFDLSRRYLGKKSHEAFGDIHFFTKPSKEQGEQLWEAMDKVSTRLGRYGLAGLLDLPVAFELHHPGSKYPGWFKRSKDPEVRPHQIGYRFLSSESNLRYVLLHELGHLLDMHVLRKHKEHWAKWIRLYMTSVEPLILSIADSKQLRKDLFQAAAEEKDLRKWLASLDVEERRKANLILAWIRKVHSITTDELDCLLGSEEEERIHELWPVEVISVKGTVPLVTEYATKNVSELFAEAFALHLVGKELPKSVGKLLEKSLLIAKAELKS